MKSLLSLFQNCCLSNNPWSKKTNHSDGAWPSLLHPHAGQQSIMCPQVSTIGKIIITRITTSVSVGIVT